MTEAPQIVRAGYRFIPVGANYSGGVAAESGFEIERVRFVRPLPLPDAFSAIAAHLKAIDRPTDALAHCELRSPAQFDDQSFGEFNRHYIAELIRLGVYRDGANPVARTNVCPEHEKPDLPSIFAFSYTVPAADRERRSFSLSGCSDSRPGTEPYRERIVRPMDVSPQGIRAKVEFVVDQLEQRLARLGFSWQDAITVQVYALRDFREAVVEGLARRRAMRGGLVWYCVRPPLIGLEFEMDVRRVMRELIL